MKVIDSSRDGHCTRKAFRIVAGGGLAGKGKLDYFEQTYLQRCGSRKG